MVAYEYLMEVESQEWMFVRERYILRDKTLSTSNDLIKISGVARCFLIRFF